MNASIHDVAKRAGVSISTVSRVINNSAGVKDSKAAAEGDEVDNSDEDNGDEDDGDEPVRTWPCDRKLQDDWCIFSISEWKYV